MYARHYNVVNYLPLLNQLDVKVFWRHALLLFSCMLARIPLMPSPFSCALSLVHLAWNKRHLFEEHLAGEYSLHQVHIGFPHIPRVDIRCLLGVLLEDEAT